MVPDSLELELVAPEHLLIDIGLAFPILQQLQLDSILHTGRVVQIAKVLGAQYTVLM